MTLLHFVQSLGDAPSLRSVTGGMLPRFAQLLGGCSLTFAQSLFIQWFHHIEKWSRTPPIEKSQRSHKYAFLRANGVTLLSLGASS